MHGSDFREAPAFWLHKVLHPGRLGDGDILYEQGINISAFLPLKKELFLYPNVRVLSSCRP